MCVCVCVFTRVFIFYVRLCLYVIVHLLVLGNCVDDITL